MKHTLSLSVTFAETHFSARVFHKRQRVSRRSLYFCTAAITLSYSIEVPCPLSVRPSGKKHRAPRSICRSCRFGFHLSIDTNGVGDNKGRDITNVEVDNKEFNFTHVLDKVKAKLRDVTRVVSPTIVKLATLDQHQQGGGQMRGQRTVAI